MMVIPNGFDLEIFKPNPAARRSVRKRLEIPDEAPLRQSCCWLAFTLKRIIATLSRLPDCSLVCNPMFISFSVAMG